MLLTIPSLTIVTTAHYASETTRLCTNETKVEMQVFFIITDMALASIS